MTKATYYERHRRPHEEPHHRDDIVTKLVIHEGKILVMYTAIYVFLDFLTMYFGFDDGRGTMNDLIFIGIIIWSMGYDLMVGPAEIDNVDLERKNNVLAKLVLWLLSIVVVFALITNQFLIPVELEIEGDEAVTVWDLMYRGFHATAESIGDLVASDAGDASESDGMTLSLLSEDGLPTRILIHVFVNGTKLAIFRLLIVEAELILKMIPNPFE